MNTSCLQPAEATCPRLRPATLRPGDRVRVRRLYAQAGTVWTVVSRDGRDGQVVLQSQDMRGQYGPHDAGHATATDAAIRKYFERVAP